MPLNLPWLTILKYGVPALLVLGVGYWIADSLIEIGEDRVQTKWDKDVAEQKANLHKREQKVRENERKYRGEIEILKDQVISDRLAYERQLADSRVALAGQLRKSEGRASFYVQLSEAGATERANLASYAAQLDRSLVEGRQVVEELRATVIQRDKELRTVGEQLEADRKLIGVH
jgi:hypothetical protein